MPGLVISVTTMKYFPQIILFCVPQICHEFSFKHLLAIIGRIYNCLWCHHAGSSVQFIGGVPTVCTPTVYTVLWAIQGEPRESWSSRWSKEMGMLLLSLSWGTINFTSAAAFCSQSESQCRPGCFPAKERRKPSCIGTGGREQSRSLSKSDRNERERVRSLTEQSCGQSRFSLPQSSQSQENARRLTGIHKNSNPGLINVSKQFNDLL